MKKKKIGRKPVYCLHNVTLSIILLFFYYFFIFRC